MAVSKDLLVDKRIVDRNIKEGLISQTDHRKYLESLPDVSDKMEFVKLPGDDGDGLQGGVDWSAGSRQ